MPILTGDYNQQHTTEIQDQKTVLASHLNDNFQGISGVVNANGDTTDLNSYAREGLQATNYVQQVKPGSITTATNQIIIANDAVTLFDKNQSTESAQIITGFGNGTIDVTSFTEGYLWAIYNGITKSYQATNKEVANRPSNSYRIASFTNNGGTVSVVLDEEKVWERKANRFKEKQEFEKDIQVVGNLTVTGTSVIGAFQRSRLAKSANYTMVAGDYAIDCDATNGAFLITLKTGVKGDEALIRKSDTSNNAITIGTPGSETIAGLSTILLRRQNESVLLRYDGTDWQIVNSVGCSLSGGSAGNIGFFSEICGLRAFISWNGGGGASANNAFNCSVVRTAVGRYTITFDFTFPHPYYIVSFSAYNTAGASQAHQLTSRSTTNLTVAGGWDGSSGSTYTYRDFVIATVGISF